MEKYCPKPHPVYFNAFSMWQQLSGSVQYLIIVIIYIVYSKSFMYTTWEDPFAHLLHEFFLFQF